MKKIFIRHTLIILLMASVMLFSAGCESSSGSGTPEAGFESSSGSSTPEAGFESSSGSSIPEKTVSKDSDAAQNTTQEAPTSSEYEPTETIELSNYILNNIDLVHDEIGGNRYDSTDGITYTITEPGDIFVSYSNKDDQGLYVLNIYMVYSGDYRAGNSAYSLFGCKLGDTATDVRNKLTDYGFQTTNSAENWEYLEIFDGEWKLTYKCDNGFLSAMEVNVQKRTMEQAVESEMKTGYYVAALTGHPTNLAYIDEISTSDGNTSISFSGVFEEGTSENSETHMTDYMTFTVFPDENTVYAGGDEFDTYYYSEEEFINIMKSFNGLGVALTVDNGTLVKAVLMS